jgi:hypothetical protein
VQLEEAVAEVADALRAVVTLQVHGQPVTAIEAVECDRPGRVQQRMKALVEEHRGWARCAARPGAAGSD